MLMRDDIKGSLEAILFIRSEQISLKELAEIIDIPQSDLKSILDEMIIEYNEKKKGIQIVEADNGYIMCTNPAYSDILARIEKPVRRKLSPAALEILAIIAYRQPVTRIEIEKVRGVKSDRTINSLVEKGLIEEAGHKQVVGKPCLYITTAEFLKVFGLSSLEELPDLEED